MSIAEERWKKTDRLLKRFQKQYDLLSDDTKTELLYFLNNIEITPQELNKRVSERDSRKLSKLIKDNEKIVKANEYLRYQVQTRHEPPTYREYIMITLLIFYSRQAQKGYILSKDLWLMIAADAFIQAKREIGREPKTPYEVTWLGIRKFLVVNTLKLPLIQYLMILAVTFSEELFKLFLTATQRAQKRLTEEDLSRLLEKQNNRVISVNGPKESGVFVDVGRELWHKVYVEPYKEENPQVRFIAERDDKTTLMCKGMDDMLFYTNDWNRYYRYSDLDKKDVLYTTFGLVRGENLPPIDNHFHWCRSTITYQIDKPREELKGPY